jgi:hypothetical protein
MATKDLVLMMVGILISHGFEKVDAQIPDEEDWRSPCSLSSAGNPEPRKAMVQGVIRGAGAMVLLAVCLGLSFCM